MDCYAVLADIAPIIQAYESEHFNFLVMKLKPGAGGEPSRN